MEADSFSEARGGSGLSNRQRRRRDRERYTGDGSSPAVDEWQAFGHGDFGSYQGRRGGGIGARTDFRPVADFSGDFVNGVFRPDNGTHEPDFVNGVYRPEGRYWPDSGGYGRSISNGHYEGQRGRGEGRRSRGRGYGGRQNYHDHALPPSPPWPDQEEHNLKDGNLKDLLLQVAPQARIVENTSRLSSKASANILSRVLSEAANSSATPDCNGKLDQGNDAVSSAFYGNDTGNIDEDDEESAFMERWSGLFSRGSPLVEGSLEDPFGDVKKRTKVVWKKGNDRKGHRTRQQLRKQQREQALLGENGDKEYDDGQFDEEAGASVVYDASRPQWQPRRPPANEEIMFQ
mmetsp:Transcript_55807/g.88445  ORF Transcript_55807/g.88445 Transcript_55807/m.88445 type:complete len:346 (-) Transcript_55807:3-1040(-)